MPDLALLVVVLAVLVPPLAAAGWGRRLGRAPDEPGVAERWQAYVRAVTTVATLVVVATTPFSGGFAPAVAIVTILATVAATLPARGRVFGETWRLPAFLAYVVRFQLALVGFWLALAFAPTLVSGAGSLRAPVALVLGVLLMLYFVRHGQVLARVMGATPIDSPATTARFAEIIARSELAATPPQVLRAGSPIAGWPNAVALPGLAGARVVVGDTLLEKLDLDERAAIFAHELAHLEHHPSQRLRRGAMAGCLLVVIAVGLVPWTVAAGGETSLWLVNLGWLVCVVIGYARALARHQQGEVEADRRALALTGDPDALVRGLSKLHALAHLPRRMDLDCERAASHPSLASRIRAIREAAGFVPQPFAGEVVLASTAPGRFAVLAPEQAVFLDGVAAPDGVPSPAATFAPDDAESLRQRAGSSRAFAYRALAELRVKVALDGAATLIAVSTAGETLQLPLAPASVVRAQEALDALDGRLAPRTAARSRLHPAGALVAGLNFLLAFLPGAGGAVVPLAWLALVRPQVAPLLALGLMATGFGAVGLAQALLAGASADELLAALGRALGGLAGLWLARQLWHTRPEARFGQYRAVLGLLGAMTLVCLPLALAGMTPVFDGAWLAGPLAAVAFAAVILLRHHARPMGRIAAAGVVLLAGAAIADGARELGRDELTAEAPEPVWTPLAPTAEPRALALPGFVHDVQLAPSGRRFFGIAEPPPREAPDDVDLDDDRPHRFVVSDLDGQTFDVTAVALAFAGDADDDRLFALRRSAEGMVLEEVGAGGARGALFASLPALRAPRLAVSGTRFRVVGRTPRTFVRFDGELGGAAPTSFEAPVLTDGYRMSWIPSGEPGVALSIVMQIQGHKGQLFGRHRHETLLVLENRAAAPLRVLRTQLHVACPDLPLGESEFLCTGTSDRRTEVFSVVADGRFAEGAAAISRLRVRGRSHGASRAGDTLGFWQPDALVLVDPLDGIGVRVPVAAGKTGNEVALAARAFAVASFDPARADTRVTIHAR